MQVVSGWFVLLYKLCAFVGVYDWLSPQELTIVVSTGTGAPGVPSYPVLGGISGSPCHKYRDLVL